MPIDFDIDYLVIGSGLAGLTYALTVAPHGSVAVLTKRRRTDANSSMAQGGIAGAVGEDDSFELHKQDTLTAGAGLCHEDAVDILVHEGPERIRDLMSMGARFNTELNGSGTEILSLGREGGHSRNRIVHTADYTGWECERTLLDAVKANNRIQIHEHFFVTRLITSQQLGATHCIGAEALNSETGTIENFRAKCTLLATGGCGQIYRHTTNPLVATGDGVAIAWQAGVPIANMEFIQFHPTTLYHPNARAFLITEALRGEGGILRHADGEKFMHRYHALGELAPRDIVARAIVSEMKQKGAPCVYLDATHLDHHLLQSHFPTILERCLSVGIDITREPIPIAPAQHYQCGGVQTDLNACTALHGLYAAGEVACTGVHGANRLASNSLLEAMVFGYRAALHSEAYFKNVEGLRPEPMESACATSPAPIADYEAIVGRVKRTMQNNVGIIRSDQDLHTAESDIASALDELESSVIDSPEAWEAINTSRVAWLVVQSALRRKESRGLHYTLDYPNLLESEKHDTVLVAPRIVEMMGDEPAPA